VANKKLIYLLPIFIILALGWIFYEKIPYLGTGELGYYPVFLFFLILIIGAIIENLPRFKDYLYYFGSFNNNVKIKLLIFRGHFSFVATKGYGGYSRIKLKNGKKFKVWSGSYSGPNPDKFKFKGRKISGELKKDLLLINKAEHKINYVSSGITINYNSSIYKIDVSRAQIIKDEKNIASYKIYPSNTYIEILFNIPADNKEEYLFIGLAVMDIFLFN
jgi:hypothetical protein